MMKSDNKFNILLRLRKTCWQAGLALAALLFMAGTAGIVLLSYGLFDFFLALPEQARVFAGVCIIFCFAGLVISWLISILKKNNAQAAGYLDSLAGGKEILSALELQRQYQDASEFKQFLIDKVLNNAQHKLNALALSAVLPWMLIRKRLIFFASATFIIVFMFVLNPVA